MSIEDLDSEEPLGPWFRILVARQKDDTIVRGLAEEAAALFRARGKTVIVTESPDVSPPPDGVLIVAGEGGDVPAVESVAPDLAGRAVALAVVSEERPEGAAIAQSLRNSYRTAKAFVLSRQLVVSRDALGIYGLEDETAREKMDGLVELLVFDADRLLAKREGWEEPDEARSVEWKGPHVREREEVENDRE